MRGPAARRAGRHAVNLGLRLLAVGVALAALAVPAYAYWDSTRTPPQQPAPQVVTPLPKQPLTLARMPTYEHGVIALCYHDVTPDPGNEYMVSPRAFAAQMAALKAQGFHTISAAQFARFAQGEAVKLPSRPLLISFDDGTKGTWVYADPILRRLGFQATGFLITGEVSRHQPYYLTWEEVEEMNASGRWSFGSHTDHGHGYVQSNEGGREGPFLTNLEWQRRARRLESLPEYVHRVRSDLNESIARLQRHGLPRPLAFAFPFSASEPANDSAVVGELRRILGARFPALVDNRDEPIMVRPGMGQPLPRIEVHRNSTTRSVLDRVKHAIVHGKRIEREMGVGGAAKGRAGGADGSDATYR